LQALSDHRIQRMVPRARFAINVVTPPGHRRTHVEVNITLMQGDANPAIPESRDRVRRGIHLLRRHPLHLNVGGDSASMLGIRNAAYRRVMHGAAIGVVNDDCDADLCSKRFKSVEQFGRTEIHAAVTAGQFRVRKMFAVHPGILSWMRARWREFSAGVAFFVQIVESPGAAAYDRADRRAWRPRRDRPNGCTASCSDSHSRDRLDDVMMAAIYGMVFVRMLVIVAICLGRGRRHESGGG